MQDADLAGELRVRPSRRTRAISSWRTCVNSRCSPMWWKAPIRPLIPVTGIAVDPPHAPTRRSNRSNMNCAGRLVCHARLPLEVDVSPLGATRGVGVGVGLRCHQDDSGRRRLEGECMDDGLVTGTAMSGGARRG